MRGVFAAMFCSPPDVTDRPCPNFDHSAKELELCIAYGNISFDLLKYLFTPGDELTTIDMGGKVFVLLDY